MLEQTDKNEPQISMLVEEIMMSWQQQVVVTIQQGKEKVVALDLDRRTITYDNKIKIYRSITGFKGDEEIVRAFIINRLVNELNYKAERIEIEKEYQAGRPKKIAPRIDAILRDTKGNAYFFIEVKSPDKFESDKNYIDGQLFRLAKLEGNVQYLVYYTLDFQNGRLMDKAIIIDYNKFPDYRSWLDAGSPSISDELSAQYNKPRKEPLIKGGRRDLITSFNQEELRSLATNLHNVLWGGGGTGDTEIFSSLVNIILAKIEDEYKTSEGEEYEFQIHQYGDDFEKADDLYNRINKRYREALTEQLYVTDNVSEQYVINRQKFPLNKLVYTVGQFEKYSFVDGKSSLNGKDLLGDFFEQIQRDGFKQTKGQFFTPINIVRFIVYALEIDNMALKRLNEAGQLPHIIDPACGSGTFLIEAMRTITNEVKRRRRSEVGSSRQVQERFWELFEPDSKEHRWARTYLYGIEHNFDLGTAAKVNMILHGDGSTNIFVKDGLLPFRFYEKPSSPSYLTTSRSDSVYNNKDINGNFDLIASNPPFSVNLDNETKKYLELSFLFGAKKNSENLFIERYYQLLREGGRLGVVLPESIFDTSENKYIRLFLYKFFHVCAVVSLPQLTFEHYTSTKTSLLFAKKKTRSEIEEWNSIWNKYAAEWERLKTRVENYIRVYLEGEKKSIFPSIKNDDEVVIRQNLSRFLRITFSNDDITLTIVELLQKYRAEIEEALKIDRDLTSIYGFSNLAWVLAETATEKNYPTFMAEVENVGYKRTKRGEKTQPNDLFDLEVAPDFLDLDDVKQRYENEIDEIEKRKAVYEQELIEFKKSSKNNNLKEIIVIGAKIKNLDEQLTRIKLEQDEVIDKLAIYYDRNGKLFEKYKTRHDEDLLNLFESRWLSLFKSENVLIRQAEHTTILDFMRQAGIWK